MAMALLSVLGTPLTELGKCLFDPLKRQICYLINYDANLLNLKNHASNLSTKRKKIQNLVDEARRRLEEPDEIVLKWLEQATTIGLDVRRLGEEVSETKRCFKGLSPDWGSRRRRLSKQAVKMSQEINELQENGNFNSVSHIPPPPGVEPVRTHCVEGLASRDLVMNQVMEALRNKNIRSIGLYGMGGIGKTTIVNKLNNELQGSQLFNKVILVIVSNSPDLKRIQDDIGSRLGLYLKPESTQIERANRLFERLKQEKSVLIILDDLWKRLEVEEIGIPSGSVHVGCKVILTTRIQDVCREMEIQTAIKVEPLSEDESWVLFKEKAGNVVKRPTLLPLAQKIARKCKGSPLAIVVLGSLLRDIREEFEWKYALRALENPDPIELEGIIPEVIASLRYSYDHLKGPEIKLCFLFFCLFPEDYNIPLSNMRDYGIGDGFLKVDGSLEDAWNKLLGFVRRLKACSLLLDSDEEECVKMHDVVRDVAISIASKDENGFLVKAGVGLRNLPEMEKLKSCRRISFIENGNIEHLPSPLECPLLLTLLLQRSNNLKINQENLFERVKALAVLDLSYTSPALMPESLGHLTNLRTLYLGGRNLSLTASTSISVLGGLKNLKILNLSNSDIERLPEEIGNLTNLRCLDLTGARRLSSVARNVISRLSKLEELKMWGSFQNWDMYTGGGEINASFAEVASLPNLVTLQIILGNDICASHDIPYSWKNLKEIVFILKVPGAPSYGWASDSVEIYGVNVISNWVRILCQKARNLNLSSCYGWNSLAYIDAVGGFSHLKRLHVEECNEMEYLLSIGEEARQDVFGGLEELRLACMDNMKKILDGLPPAAKLFRHLSDKDEEATSSSSRQRQLRMYSSKYFESAPKSTFQNLRLLTITECSRLKSLFSFCLARGLQQLQELDVSKCYLLKEIIAIEQDEEKEAAVHQEGLLPQLRRLVLAHLHCLTNVCQDNLLLDYSSLEYISVVRCPNLKRLPRRPQQQGVSYSYPVEISGRFEWRKKFKWESEHDI